MLAAKTNKNPGKPAVVDLCRFHNILSVSYWFCCLSVSKDKAQEIWFGVNRLDNIGRLYCKMPLCWHYYLSLPAYCPFHDKGYVWMVIWHAVHWSMGFVMQVERYWFNFKGLISLSHAGSLTFSWLFLERRCGFGISLQKGAAQLSCIW